MDLALLPVVLKLGPVLIGIAGIAYAIWKSAGEADDEDALYGALEEAGFQIELDPGSRWLRSQMPNSDLAQVTRSRKNRHGPPLRADVTVRLARREDAQARQVVFRLPESVERAHDRFAVAVDPKNRAVVNVPDQGTCERIRAETGWSFEAHGAWLLLYREQPTTTKPGEVAAVVDEALAVARRLLGAGLR